MSRGAPPKKPVILGERMYNLVVIEDAGNRKPKYERYVKCQCDCGKQKIVKYQYFKIGQTKSCGCRKLLGTRLDHGRSHTAIHGIWTGMLSRCYNKREAPYMDYGGRGIVVCERWHEFKNFLEDMGERPSKDHSLDRINNDGNYDPSNCRWATRKQQARNTRRNTYYEYNGERLSQVEWAERFGVGRALISSRIKKGHTFDQIVEYIKTKVA